MEGGGRKEGFPKPPRKETKMRKREGKGEEGFKSRSLLPVRDLLIYANFGERGRGVFAARGGKQWPRIFFRLTPNFLAAIK